MAHLPQAYEKRVQTAFPKPHLSTSVRGLNGWFVHCGSPHHFIFGDSMSLRHSLVALTLSFLAITTPAFAKDPYCKTCPLSCSDLGFSKKDCLDLKSRDNVCCVHLSDSAFEIVRAQDSVSTETCPPGFTASEQKCSDKERRNGCKDIRLPSGLGCVKR